MPDGRGVWTYSENGDGTIRYDFSSIDAVYDRCLAAGIRPIVELDFLPPALRDACKLPLNTPDMWSKWGDLLRAFIRHLQERYGIDETRQWYFEIWNEPDLWPRDRIEDFFRIHAVAVAAIESIGPHLRIGGPAAAALPVTDYFLQNAHFGNNPLTGQQGMRCDYFSLHQYGVSGNTLPWYPAMMPRPQEIVTRTYWLYEIL